MNSISTDVDIDLLDRRALLDLIPHVPASIITESTLRPHNTGIYLQDIPRDPLTGLATVGYDRAGQYGYFKIDILSASVYEGIRSEADLIELATTEPIWEMLEDEEIIKTSRLWQIHDHASTVARMRPRSVEQLAAVLGVIRPAKAHLEGLGWPEVMADVWVKPTDPDKAKSFYKKPHAIAYATALVVQMNYITQRALRIASQLQLRLS